jgi:hypothetical protein
MAAPTEKLVIQIPDRDGALLVVFEHVADKRQRRGRQRRPGDSEHRARGDQHLRARRERRDDRGGAERAGADQEQPTAADPVAQRPHRDQEAGNEEAVDVDDPEQLGAARPQVGAERGNREREDREVHRVEQARQRDHGEADPLAPGGALWLGGDLSVALRHSCLLEVRST